MKFFIDEEYGYRYWFWETGKSKQEMIDWWCNLESVDKFFFNPSQTLPFGKVFSIYEDCMHTPETEGYVHLHCDNDSFMRIDGESYYHKGYSSCV